MVQKKVALPAIGVGAVLAGGLLGRQLIASWRKNPDPLDGRQVRFPDGEQRFVELPDGARISTITVGSGPAIVCVHGVTASRRDWAPMAPHLVDAGYTVIAVEQRGHGDSTVGTAGFGSTQLGDDLAVVLDALDVRSATLMGQSMGGMAVMAFAVDHEAMLRERIDRLVLIATAGAMTSGLQSIGLTLSGIDIPDALDPADKRLRVGAGLLAFGAKPSLHMVDEAIAMFRRCPEPVRTAASPALKEHDVLDQLHAIDLPALVVGGTRDQLIRPTQIEALADALANAHTTMFDGAGHMLIWERHEEVAALVADFVRSTTT